MRKSKGISSPHNAFSILTLDDDPIITATLQAYFQRSGYQVDVENEPYQAIERIRNGNYDILLLDFLMIPISGDKVVEEVRKFNKEIFIILLTGHKSVAPPVKTLRELDIQGYYEKNDRFDQLELLVESCVKSIQQMRTIRGYRNGLTSILDALPQLYHLQQLDEIARTVLDTAGTLVENQGGALEIFPEFAGGGAPVNGGSYLLCDTAEPPPCLTELLEKTDSAWLHQIPILEAAPWLFVFIFDSLEKPVGLLSLQTLQPLRENDRQMLCVLARQVAVSLTNYMLHEQLQVKNEELTCANQGLGESYLEMISALRLVVDAKDVYTHGHSERVAKCAEQIARAMGESEPFCEMVQVAGLFHDIGKLGVPDSVLRKESPLTSEEYDCIKSHPGAGAHILAAITRFQEITPVVRAHHERYDGRGYPDGLSGEQIPLAARIIAVADSFDAMMSNRVYRKALSLEAAVRQLQQGRGTQFDSDIVDAFLPFAKEYAESTFGAEEVV